MAFFCGNYCTPPDPCDRIPEHPSAEFIRDGKMQTFKDLYCVIPDIGIRVRDYFKNRFCCTLSPGGDLIPVLQGNTMTCFIF